MTSWLAHRLADHPIGWTLLVFSIGVNFGTKFGADIQRAIGRLLDKHGRG